MYFQVIAAMAGFAYVMDKDGAFRNSFSAGWDRILSKHPIPFYYCIGKLMSLNNVSIDVYSFYTNYLQVRFFYQGIQT